MGSVFDGGSKTGRNFSVFSKADKFLSVFWWIFGKNHLFEVIFTERTEPFGLSSLPEEGRPVLPIKGRTGDRSFSKENDRFFFGKWLKIGHFLIIFGAFSANFWSILVGQKMTKNDHFCPKSLRLFGAF